MNWLQRYRIRRYFRESIWILPVLGMVMALAAVPLLHSFEEAWGWDSPMTPETARVVLGTLVASMFTFIVFICSTLLLAVQLASVQLTPRIIAIVFRDPVTKSSLTVFVFTFTFALAVLARVNTVVPIDTVRVAALLCLASLCVFLFLIDHVGRWLRPSGALRAVAQLGHAVIETVYPIRLDNVRGASWRPLSALTESPTLTVPSLKNGVVLAFDLQGLVSLAQHADCVIEMVPQVGDFVARGNPLFRVFGKGATLTASALRRSVAVGQERTLEQDPALAFRIMVDIASKGLSPAINDPTTAVLAIDQIHRLLRNVGSRHLDDERVRDATGQVRLVYRTPAWEDFVQLAVMEIRHFGGASIQVARRLRAMLEDLIQTLPEDRRPPLRQELSLLHRSAERFFPEPEDRTLAEVSDSQGVGSKPGRIPPSRSPDEARFP
jgi:uncharacterized membrane protein